ncbi:hypothetical protein F4825DRAFT_469135 [Nemania diffusa]|nr:hypothetical protein F4825DRAFT_469135 [Nemania diffusa]
MEVEALIPQLQDTLSEIKDTVHGLSTKTQNDELDKLEQKRERLLEDLQASFERERKELETKRRTELEDIKKKRKQEDEERAARRQREDEELKKVNSKEDKQQQQRRKSTAETIEDETGQQMDQLEEETRKLVKESKKKLQDLDEKRRELNRRIDEQLKQPIPSAPPRKRERQSKEKSNSPKDATNGDSASSGLGDNNPSPKSSNKADTPSKHRESGDLPAKSPESKKDGELPFQDVPNSLPQATKGSTKKLPKSFAEALKSNMSNGSKGKPRLEKGSSDRMTTEEDDHIERHREALFSEGGGIDAGHMVDTLTKLEDIEARGSAAAAPTKVEDIRRGKEIIENIELLPAEQPELENAHNQCDEELPQSDRGSLSASSLHNITGFEPAFATNQRPTTSKVGPLEQEPPPEKTTKQHCTSISSNAEPCQLNKNTEVNEVSEVPEGTPKKSHAPVHVSDEEIYTVGSRSRFKPQSRSNTSEKRGPGQGNETDDQMECEQRTSTNLLEQEHSGDDRDFREGLGHPCIQSSKSPTWPVPSTPPCSLQGEFVSSLDGQTGSFSLEPSTGIGFERMINPAIEHMPATEPQVSKKPASPLPVENETVRGQDRLFDDHKSVSDRFEPHSGDEGSDSSPQTPVEGQELPVLLGPAFDHRLYEQGVITLDESRSWQILNEQAHKEHSQLSSKPPPQQDAGDFDGLDTKATTGNNDLRNNWEDKLHPEINLSRQPMHQDLFPTTKSSPPAQHTLHKAANNKSRAGPLSQDIYPTDSRDLSYLQPAPIKPLYSQVLSNLAGPTRPETLKNKRRSSSPGPPRKRVKRRGRQMHRSSRSHGRTLNPREQLFQENDDEIDIKSGWFKRSKRGLS